MQGGNVFLQGIANVTFSDFVLLPESRRSDESYKPVGASESHRRARGP